MKNPDQLITDYLDDDLSTSNETALNAWLKADDQNMRRFADAVLFDQQIRAAARARQVQSARKLPIEHRRWLGRAAAGIGTVPFLNQLAAASVLNQSAFLLMKKAITSATAAILLAGGCGLYFIHQQNEASRVRTAKMEIDAQTLSKQLGLTNERSASSTSSTASGVRKKSAAEIIVILNKRVTSLAEQKLRQDVRDEIAAMDAESLKNLMLDAEKLSNPADEGLVLLAMRALIEKDPAEASKLAVLLVSRGSQFQFQLSVQTEDAFKAWLAKDPAAADAWYAATAAAHGFDSKAIAPNGYERWDISRSLARLRFTALAAANPAQAEAMLGSMVEADAIVVMQELTDPALVARLLPKLSTGAKDRAAQGAIKALAASDLGAAFAWAGSLDMPSQQRDYLLAVGVESAAASGKLDLGGVKQWSQKLALTEERRSHLLAEAAFGVTQVSGANEPKAVWDRVPGTVAWLRAEAPASMASESVGRYLGQLAYHHGVEGGLQAYEQEAARLGAQDEQFTFAFTSYLGMHRSAEARDASLKLLEKLPPSPKRDQAVRLINVNSK